ncbi:hypothetical protein BN844_0239 [Pseudomonas sp. SHC52]|nr:hypothetical protein BN844_0239 [Pseudomonas sp. SHC52]
MNCAHNHLPGSSNISAAPTHVIARRVRMKDLFHYCEEY